MSTAGCPGASWQAQVNQITPFPWMASLDSGGNNAPNDVSFVRSGKRAAGDYFWSSSFSNDLEASAPYC